MKCVKELLLLTIILLLVNGCAGLLMTYTDFNEIETEISNKTGEIGIYPHFDRQSIYIWPLAYLQPILPYPLENYEIHLDLSSIDLSSDDDPGNMLYVVIDEIHIVLPLGKTINLLDKDIDAIYRYRSTEENYGTYMKLQNVILQNLNGSKWIFLDGLNRGSGHRFSGDSVSVVFKDVRIPSYFVNSVRLEYSLTIAWENLGKVKKRQSLVFSKEAHEWYLFTH